jgi:DNA-binding NtrC family response regulator
MMDKALAGEGHEAAAAESVEEARRQLAGRDFALVLTDLKLPDGSGIDVLERCRETSPQTPVVVLTAYGSVTTAVEAMKQGAVDFLEKPLEIEDLFRLVARLLGGEGDSECFEPPGGPAIVGRHPSLRQALRLLERVAPTESTVLLTGESGTGKELFARAIHALSPRLQGPFVAVNCAAIPEALMENELFGHEKGAFTGADRRQSGRFEIAAGGTLLLDEVGELSQPVQAKVLRVLEERTFERVGGGATQRAHVRLVAATNRNLEQMVETGAFRADLYFRLDVFPIALPPLRERSTDIPPLCRHLLARIAERHRVPAPELRERAAELLAAQPWPGNVRQLANVLERALILAPGPRLDVVDLKPLLEPLGDPAAAERERLRETLAETDGDKRRAAELLGVSYRTLLRRIKEHDLEGFPRYRR